MMWSKLSHSEFIYFTILDRTRYYLTLLLLEIVLVLVVVLSTVSQDVLHLLYVLLAIFLFRCLSCLPVPFVRAVRAPLLAIM